MLAHRTARGVPWLTGLRGLAALLVYLHHHQLGARDRPVALMLERGFGFRGEYHLATLPGVRTIVTGGHFAVAVLLVVSGFAAALGPLSVCYYGGDDRPVADTNGRAGVDLPSMIASSLFRRWPRLYVPMAVTTFAYMSSWYLPGVATSWNEDSGHGRPADAGATWSVEARRWADEFVRYSFFFDGLQRPWFRYNDHLWSLLLEWRGSVTVYAALLVLARCRSRIRIGLEALLIAYHLVVVDGWYCAMALSGALLAELHVAGATRPKAPTNRPSIASVALLILAVYLGNVPHVVLAGLRQMPGWMFLSRLHISVAASADPKWFYLFWAASLLMLVTMRLPALQRVLETRPLQFLGRVSFALYLVHGPVLWTLGNSLYRRSGLRHSSQVVVQAEGSPSPPALSPSSWTNIVGFEVNFWVAQLALFPVTLSLAYVVTVLVDEPNSRFWWMLYGRLALY